MRSLLHGERLARRDAVMETLRIGITRGVMVAPGKAGDAVTGWLAPDGLGQWAYTWDTSEPPDGRPPGAWTRGAQLSLSLAAAPCISIEAAARTFGSVRVSLRVIVGDPPPGARPDPAVRYRWEWLEAVAEFRPGTYLALAFDDDAATQPCATRATLVQARRS